MSAVQAQRCRARHVYQRRCRCCADPAAAVVSDSRLRALMIVRCTNLSPDEAPVLVVEAEYLPAERCSVRSRRAEGMPLACALAGTWTCQLFGRPPCAVKAKRNPPCGGDGGPVLFPPPPADVEGMSFTVQF